MFAAISNVAPRRLCGLSVSRMAAVLILLLWATAGLQIAVASNKEDPVYLDARNAESSGDYATALSLYTEFLESWPDSELRGSIGTRVAVINESLQRNETGSLALYLDALQLREDRDAESALDELRRLRADFPGSHLVDDALYLSGYISLMDTYDFQGAHEYMRELQSQYPESSYRDTANYSEAIALEQLGDTDAAWLKFEELRERHTEFSFAFIGTHWPKSNYLSRYWFERANNRLKILARTRKTSARMLAQDKLGSDADEVKVNVSVKGVEFVLALRPSPLVQRTEFASGSDLPVDLSSARLYAGMVEGDDSSWARVMLRGDSIEGVVMSYGERYELTADSLIGTIDYYRAGIDKRSETGLDEHYVLQPPRMGEALPAEDLLQRQTGQKGEGVTRLLKLNIVIDSQYNDYYGGNGLSQAMTYLNIADGIYREKFGMALEVGNALVYTDRSADPMNLGAVTLEQTLRTFRDFRLARNKQVPAAGLTYLFSGNRNTDEAIGLAWIGAICRTDGFDVGVTTPSSYGDLLVTHELGHSMGAQHDTDTNCSGESNRLMWPRISGTTRQDFTNCSSDSVNVGMAKACLFDALDLSVSLEAEQAQKVIAQVQNNDYYQTSSDSTLSLEVAALDIEQLPPGCSDSTTTEIACSVGSLQPGEARSFEFPIGSMARNGTHVIASLSSHAAFDPYPGNNASGLSLRNESEGEAIWVASNTPVQPQNTPSQLQSTASASDALPSTGGSSGGSAAWLWLIAGIAALGRLR